MEVVGKVSRDMDFESLYCSFHSSGIAKNFILCLNVVDGWIQVYRGGSFKEVELSRLS